LCARRLLMSTASCVAASASSRRPRVWSITPRSFRLAARSGRKASGRFSARRLLMSMASLIQARRVDGLFIQARREIGSALREAPVDVDGLLRRGQRLLVAPEIVEADAEVSQARLIPCTALVRSALREASSYVDGLLDRGQRLLAAAKGVEHRAEVIQARRENGEEGVGLALREAPADVDGLLRRGQRLLAAAEDGEYGGEVIQARREIG